ncbi:hypothetical protein E2C01_083491 [Portunus trituberculatus]|uniref:Uncharacterized protein n=1 Tax=Portunus trituberculatus TaxID=210409 RepID=A0A5B7J3M6_PORTR|nr:hypothetical protein [Portunus trituberculatus]
MEKLCTLGDGAPLARGAHSTAIITTLAATHATHTRFKIAFKDVCKCSQSGLKAVYKEVSKSDFKCLHVSF